MTAISGTSGETVYSTEEISEIGLSSGETTAGVLPQTPNLLPHGLAETAAKSESQRSQTEEAAGPNLHHVEHRSPSMLIRGCITIFSNLKLHCGSLYARHNVLEASVPAGKTRIRWTCVSRHCVPLNVTESVHSFTEVWQIIV